MDKSLIDIVKKRMEEKNVNVQLLSKQTGIPADRIYKWFQRNLNPKSEDADKLREWLNSNNELVIVPRETMAPAYRHQLWFNKVSPDSETFVPLIPYKARAGYSRNYENVDYINSEFEPYQMPPGISPRGADWRWFEVGGTSMVPTLMPGDFLLCSLLPTADWMDIEQFKIHVIVWKSEVSVKRIAIKETGEWVLISENEEEEKQIKINLSDIKEIWKVRRRITAQLPPTKRLKITV
jgi:phage repressor protein C with HTH and peptisase S24 domain